MAKRGKLFVLTGPSGAGKGTILEHILKAAPNLFLSVSATTRAPRAGEQEGIHYFFLSREAFEERVKQGDFLEYAEYVGNYYGTLEKPVDERLDEGYDVILEIEVQGAMQIHQKRPDAVLVFVAPPSMEELSRRLYGRGTEDAQERARRLQTAEHEMTYKDSFDYIVTNEVLERAVGDLLAIFRAERCRNNPRQIQGEGNTQC